MHPSTATPEPLGRRDWLALAALAGLACAAFIPSLDCGFVNYDDPVYASTNPYVEGGLNAVDVRWAFTTFDNGNWHPLTWLSLQLDATLWGVQRPRGFHLTNVLLHAANAALVFGALRSLTGAFWRSAAVALLFAVHPLRVESVAWVAERKDVLSACFGFLALWAYAGYARNPSVRRYLAVGVALALSLVAKPMLVTLPCLLLVLDWWPLRRSRAFGDWRRLAAEKLPLFALVGAACVVTVLAQSGGGAVKDLGTFPPGVRLGNAAVSYAAYLSKTAWPDNLAVFYPHPGDGLPATRVAAAALLLAAVTAGAVALRGRAPYLLAGWLWYVGTLVPVIGLVQVGVQAYADRYTYFPQVGLLIAVCWGAADLAGARTRAALAAGAAVACVLAVLTWSQQRVWRDSASLWEHSVRVAGESAPGLVSLGESFEERRQFDEAARRYRRALELDPKGVLARTNLGALLSRQGSQEEAARYLEEACDLAPNSAVAHVDLASVRAIQGDYEEAVRHYKEALRIEPGLDNIWCRLGKVESTRGRPDRAAGCYREALRLWPKSAEAHYGLGMVLQSSGHSDEAIAELREAVRLNPGSGPMHNDLGLALELRGAAAEAARHYEQAVRLSPELAGAWYNLGMTLGRQRRYAEAVGCFERAVALEPGSRKFQEALQAARSAARAAGAPPAPGR
jgi:tetratricopeptide (TPR) repeat protein